ncbi:MAG TPA: hypothetical protein PLM63_02355 [bacterium]|nr:hypothetical protein [bacterium]HPO11398.1 hypothetical protein [bacterium]
MKHLVKHICIVLFLIISIFSFRDVFSAGFNDYINGIITSSETEAVSGACKNKCSEGYYQLTFGLPFQKMSRCACVPLNQGVGAVMVSFIQLLLSSIGIIAVIILIVAGFMRAFSGGNSNVVKKANDMIKNSFIGLILVIFSGSILAIINPDLVQIGIFNPSITKVNVECVDSKMATSDKDGNDKTYTNEDGKVFNINCVYECKDNMCSAVVNVAQVETNNVMTENITHVIADTKGATSNCSCYPDSIPSCNNDSRCTNNEVCIATFLSETSSNQIVTFSNFKCFPKKDTGTVCYQNIECKSNKCKLDKSGNMVKVVETVDANGKKQKAPGPGGFCQ